MLRTKVIASSVSNLTDARYFAAWGVEGIGFDLQQVSVIQVNAFKEWISGPKIIGQFSGIQDRDAIQDVADRIGLDWIQLDPIAEGQWQFTQPVLREILIEAELPQASSSYVIKSSNPSFHVADNIEKLTEFCSAHSCYLDLNIDIEDLEIVLEKIQPEGIILRGGDEEKVGFKSFDELDEMMEALDDD